MNSLYTNGGGKYQRKEKPAVAKAREELAYHSSYHAVPPGFCIPHAPNKGVRCKEPKVRGLDASAKPWRIR